MELKLIHFYPDLMSLYGSYANVALLARHLTDLNNSVVVQTVRPGEDADLAGADFLYMGAGTERSQKAALADFLPRGEAVRAAAAAGTTMLFAGTAMELLGKSITDADGKTYEGIGLGGFSSVQGKRRFVGDVYGSTDLYEPAVVGFQNKCSVISGVDTPLLTGCAMGFGNEREGGPEGFHSGSVFASELTGPLLVKNPLMLGAVIASIYRRRNEAIPAEIPAYPYEENGYAITAQQLKLRAGQR
jgi:Predicted glutamine amidotransferase